jgi:hypothetical protein
LIVGRKRISHADKNLPPKVYFHHGAYFLVVGRKWTRLGSEYREAMAAYDLIDPSRALRALDQVTARFVKDLWHSIAKNAKKRGIPILMTKDDVAAIFNRADGRCEATGIAFSLTRIDGARARPWAPSIDRIDSARPYEADNCRLVCIAYNVARNDWPDAIWNVLVQAIASSNRRKIFAGKKNQSSGADLAQEK